MMRGDEGEAAKAYDGFRLIPAVEANSMATNRQGQ
jgi:hypothetical protein